MSGDLLQTKLFVPKPRPNLVSRQHLLDRLNQGLDQGCRLTLISAPAGYGKTTLAAGWMADLRSAESNAPAHQVAWVSFDAADNHPQRFFSYLLAALSGAGVVVDTRAQTLLQSPKPGNLGQLIPLIVNAIVAGSGPLILVLDDFHAISDLAVQEAVDALLAAAPPQLHVVIVTRQDPALSVAGMRGRGLVTELRQRDLRFTEEEAATFLNDSMRLDLTSADISVLEERTEGWVVGLQLAALSMRGRDDRSGFIESFTGSHRHVLDYLMEEVLRGLTPTMQAFLLETSILDRFTASSCQAVTLRDEAPQLLAHLDQSNLFVLPLDDNRQWYRYHHLFAELMQAKLMEQRPGLAAELHKRASQWHEAHGSAVEAVSHALATGDFDMAGGVIERSILQSATWVGTAISTAYDWLDALPDAVIEARPWLGLFNSRILYITGRKHEAFDALKALEARISHEQPDAVESAVMGMVAADWASYAATQGQVRKAISYAQQALAHIGDKIGIDRVRMSAILGLAHFRAGNTAEAHAGFTDAIESALKLDTHLHFTAAPLACNLAETEMMQGRLRQAEESCRRAMRLGTVGGRPNPPAGFSGLAMGRIRYQQNRLQDALAHLDEAEEILASGGIQESSQLILLERALIRQSLGDAATAEECLRKAVQQVSKEDSPRVTELAQAYQARVWLMQERLDKALTWAESYQSLDKAEYLRHFEDLTLAKILLASDNPDRCLEFLEPLRQQAEAASRIGHVIEILSMMANALLATGDDEKAMAYLLIALRLGEPECYVRVFMEQGPLMARLIQKSLGQGGPPAYVAMLLAAFKAEGLGTTRPADRDSREPDLRDGPLVEPLTERETEVLQLLAQGLSNKEIARRLYLSPNTIRTHTYNLYAKLGAHSRMQAVARAREMGLLPPG